MFGGMICFMIFFTIEIGTRFLSRVADLGTGASTLLFGILTKGGAGAPMSIAKSACCGSNEPEPTVQTNKAFHYSTILRILNIYFDLKYLYNSKKNYKICFLKKFMI